MLPPAMNAAPVLEFSAINCYLQIFSLTRYDGFAKVKSSRDLTGGLKIFINEALVYPVQITINVILRNLYHQKFPQTSKTLLKLVEKIYPRKTLQ
jgi:hypothetical protein